MALDVASTFDLDGARRHAEQAVAVGRRAGSRWELALALDKLAVVLAASGDFETGIPLHLEAIAVADTTEAFAFQSLFMRNNLATVLALGGKGDKEHAALLEERGALLQRYGMEVPYQARLHQLLSKPLWDDFLSVFDSYEGETIDWAHLGIHRALIEVARDGPQHVGAIEPFRLRLLASPSLANIEPRRIASGRSRDHRRQRSTRVGVARARGGSSSIDRTSSHHSYQPCRSTDYWPRDLSGTSVRSSAGLILRPGTTRRLMFWRLAQSV